MLTAVFVTMLICVSESVMTNRGPSGKISQSVFAEICQVSSANACHSLSILMQDHYLQQPQKRSYNKNKNKIKTKNKKIVHIH